MSKESVKVAKRYARSLFELCEVPALDQTREALNVFARYWRDDLALRSAMLNPAFPIPEREQALRQVADLIKPSDKIFANFAAVLLSNKRLGSITLIAQAFSEMVDNLKKLLALQVTSAFELAAQEKEGVLSRIQSECGSMASIEWKVDPALIGGMRIKAGDKVLDGSISGSLDRFRNELLA